MIVNPVSGKVYVSNTEALNQNRFEGPGTFAGHSVRGHLHESRITVLGPTGADLARVVEEARIVRRILRAYPTHYPPHIIEQAAISGALEPYLVHVPPGRPGVIAPEAPGTMGFDSSNVGSLPSGGAGGAITAVARASALLRCGVCAAQTERFDLMTFGVKKATTSPTNFHQ